MFLRHSFSRFAVRLIIHLGCFALLFPLSTVAPASARWHRQDDDEVVRVNADLVVVNVTVTDPQGQYVHKLRRADFKVFEDQREQVITTFGVEETPFAAALLLDVSGSMEGRISLARAAAIRFLDGLRADDVAAIYTFDSKVEQLQDFSPGRDLPPMAYEVRAHGLTALNDAIKRAAQDLARRPEKRRAIVVLSDGVDTHSSASVDKALANAMAAQATVYTVDLSHPQASMKDRAVTAGVLRNFADKSGGRYVVSPGGQALSKAFSEIAEELRNQYTIGYQSTNRTRDGRWRKLEITVLRPDAQLRSRRGYRAPQA